MMNKLRYICAAIVGVIMTCCGNSDVYERISSAEMAYATEDAATARRICDEIMNDGDNADNLTASQYGRMSILYMQLFDRTDDSDALDMATRCYRAAFKVNPDSATYFYNNLKMDHVQYALTLSTLVESADNPASISDLHSHMSEEDSIHSETTEE